MELNEADFGLFDPCGAPRGDNDVLVENDTLNELSVFNSTADFLNDTNIPQIDIRRSLGDETTDGLDSNRGKSGRVL